jgi:predicted secreted protein
MHTLLLAALLHAAPENTDGLDVLGWAPDGSKVAVIRHGVSDGKGTPWAKVTFYDTLKGTTVGAQPAVELEKEDDTEAGAIAAAKKLAAVELKKLHWPELVPGKTITTTEKGGLKNPDGSPIGDLELKLKKGKGTCGEPFVPQLVTLNLAVMDSDGPVSLLKETKSPATRKCSNGCTFGHVYGQARGALVVLLCQVPGFEGGATEPFPVVYGKLEFPLQAD